MGRINREQLQKRVVQHYVDVANKQKQITVNHFVQEKIPCQSIHSIIRKYEESGYVGDKPRSVVQRSYLVDSERDSNVLLIKEQEFLCVG